MQHQNWDLVQSFLALHRAGTFQAAAHRVSVDQSTLRRRIQILEQEVGTPLFVRADNCYVIAPEAQSLLEIALRMETSSRAFFQGVETGEAGTIRATMIDAFAHWLAPDLNQFRKRHPDIKIDITTEHHFVDLERELVDVAVRLARPTRGDGRLRKLAGLRYGIYAAPEYLAARASVDPDAPHNLLTLAVHFMHRDHDFLSGESDWMLRHLPPGDVVCVTDSYALLRHYCAAGLGLALLPEIIGDDCGNLVRVSGKPGAVCDLWLILRSDAALTMRVKIFTDFLRETFQRRGKGDIGQAGPTLD